MELILRDKTEIATIALNLEQIVERFLGEMDVKPASREIYRRTLKQFLVWIEENNYSMDSLNRKDIIQYKEDLLSRLSSLTVGSYLTVVRQFYEFLEAYKLYPNIARGIRTPARKQQFKKKPLQIKQAKALLSYYRKRDLRNFAIINLLLHTGLRTIEIVRANVEDITFNGSQRVLLVHGKGRSEKDNFVILTESAYKPLEKYLASRGRTNSLEPLFISNSRSNKGDRLTTRTISKLAKEGLKAIGIDAKAYTAHSLRHTAGTNILRAGGSLEQAQFMLRHSNPATTQIYTATLEEERRLENSGEALLNNFYK